MGSHPTRAWSGIHPFVDLGGRDGATLSDRQGQGGRTGIAGSRSVADGADGGTWDERAVVRGVLDGDRDAYRLLVERESGAVVRACLRVLGDHGEAEDIAQDAFVTAHRSLATWRAEGPFGAWVTRIAIRLALRRAARRRTVTWRAPAGTAEQPGGSDPADRAADRLAIDAAPRTDPAQLAVRAERASEVRAAVTALPEPYREVVALRFFADASLDDIARATDRPLGTVKTHLHRGLARLRAELEGGDR